MEIQDFIKEFEGLVGTNKFKHEIYENLEGVEGRVGLSGKEFCASNVGEFEVERPGFGIRIRFNSYQDNESIFEFISRNLVGTYSISRDNENEKTSYYFRINNPEAVSFEFEVNVYDNHLT